MVTEVNAVELKGISKSFGNVVANHNVNLSIRKGEIIALLGENGSGKTTLMNMLSGIYKPDSGSVFINGIESSINSPEDAKRLGIGMVHQHFKLIDVFSAADNIWLGKENKNGKIGFKDQLLSSKRYTEIENVSKSFGFNIDSRKKVYNMSVSEKQTLEIVKVLYYGANIIILDEPTAVLTVQEIDKLFSVLKKMKESGHSIIIITHKLNEVLEVSDRVAILRHGEHIATIETNDTNEDELTELMVGKKIVLNIEHPIMKKQASLLKILNLCVNNDEGIGAIKNMSFDIFGGEILGVAGIAGCGQKELCEALSGLRKVESGTIAHKGDNITGFSSGQIIDKGISMSFIPEDRLGMGLAPSLSITDNVILKSYRAKPLNPMVDRKAGREAAIDIINQLSIVTPSPDTPVRQLSGGNVQKVLVGREIKNDPNVIITAYPVRGLDINSSYAIYNILNRQKEKGVGILFVGEDLDVMTELCDEIMVIHNGEIMGIVEAASVTKEQLGLMMTGAMNLMKAGK